VIHPLIEVKNLTKFYGDFAALEDVSFEVKKGEILGFLGPNAAGKTTAMRILTGFMPPTSGTACVNGFDVVEDALEARRCIGYLPENVPLYEEMTVRAYLTFCAKLRQVPRSKLASHLSEVMEACKIGDVSDTLIGKLSKGYRQRVGLAQAMVHDPAVLILDEPTVGLDPRQIIEVRELIKRLGGDHTIILSTHILPEASMVCGRIVIIHEGRIVAEDTPQNLTSRLRKSQQIQLQVRGPEAEVKRKLSDVPGVLRVEKTGSGDGITHYLVEGRVQADIRESLAATVVRNGWGLLEMHAVDLSLEEIFLRLTTEEKEVAVVA